MQRSVIGLKRTHEAVAALSLVFKDIMSRHHICLVESIAKIAQRFSWSRPNHACLERLSPTVPARVWSCPRHPAAINRTCSILSDLKADKALKRTPACSSRISWAFLLLWSCNKSSRWETSLNKNPSQYENNSIMWAITRASRAEAYQFCLPDCQPRKENNPPEWKPLADWWAVQPKLELAKYPARQNFLKRILVRHSMPYLL